jgi:hypothetical protein
MIDNECRGLSEVDGLGSWSEECDKFEECEECDEREEIESLEDE